MGIVTHTNCDNTSCMIISLKHNQFISSWVSFQINTLMKTFQSKQQLPWPCGQALDVGKIKSSVSEEGTGNPETFGVRIAESQKQKKKKISTERKEKRYGEHTKTKEHNSPTGTRCGSVQLSMLPCAMDNTIRSLELL